MSRPLRRLSFCNRDVAQFGSAIRSGRMGRRFKSCHPDHLKTLYLPWLFCYNKYVLDKEKLTYIKPALSILIFSFEDIITESGCTGVCKCFSEVETELPSIPQEDQPNNVFPAM